MVYAEGDKLDPTGLKTVIRDNKDGIEIFDYDTTTGIFKDKDGTPVATITAKVYNDSIQGLKLIKDNHDGKTIDLKVGDKPASTTQKLQVTKG